MTDRSSVSWRYAGLLFSTYIAIASPASAEQSCRQEIGAKKSSELVRQCLEISPATHPPCNDANPCKLITDEITRGCAYEDKVQMETTHQHTDFYKVEFCKEYVQIQIPSQESDKDNR